MKTGNFVTASTERLVEDISHLDFRGMNQRSKNVKPVIHKPNWVALDVGTFCINCEILGSRISPKILNRINNSFRFRSKKFITKLVGNRGIYEGQWYRD